MEKSPNTTLKKKAKRKRRSRSSQLETKSITRHSARR